MSIVSNSTIDVITRGLIKYRLISHASADTIGSELIRLNHFSEYATEGGGDTPSNFYPYTRRPFVRKVKRVALDGAILAWQEGITGIGGTDRMPVVALVERLQDKNLARIERENPDYVGIPADVEDTDEGREAIMIRTREEREEEARARLAERMAALAAERAANPTSSDDEDTDDEDEWDDDTDDNYDGED
jgi:hypothetical protein